MNTRKIIHQLQQASEEIFSSYPVLFAYVYGSYAKGAVHPFSDLDIAVFISSQSTHPPLETELSLALGIDEFLDHSVETDVRSINTLPIMVIGNILTEGILIYSKDDSARVDFEVGMRKKYFDFLPVIKAYHKNFIQSNLGT